MNTILLSINWNPNPELFNLFGLPVRYYGLLWAVGIFLAYVIVHYQFRDKKISEKKSFTCFSCCSLSFNSVFICSTCFFTISSGFM